MDSKKVEFILISKWNGSIDPKEAEQDIATEIGEHSLDDLFEGTIDKDFIEGKKVYKCLILIVAFLCSGKCTEEELYQYISKDKYSIQRKRIFSGFEYVLCGRSKDISFTIGWTHHGFPNKYDWISRFFGEFYNRNLSEMIRIARVLYRVDPRALWEIAKMDPNDLLLLSFERLLYDGEKLPLEFKLELFGPEQSELRHALAFFWLTNMARGFISEEKAKEIISTLKDVDDEIVVRCLYEFVLEEHTCPKDFSKYLLKASRDKLFRNEFLRGELLRTLSEMGIVSELLSDIKDKRRRYYYFRKLRKFAVRKIGNGELGFNVKKSLDFLRYLPQEELNLLSEDLVYIENSLHAETIDYMFRQKIFLKDMEIKKTIEALKSFIKDIQV